MTRKLHLGFHCHLPAVHENGGIFMPGYLGRFVESLARQCEQVVCFQHSPLAHERANLDYRIIEPNVVLVDIGPPRSIPYRTVFHRRYTDPVRSWKERLDAFLIRGPCPLLPFMAWAAKDLPTVLLLVADLLAGIDDLPQPRWRKEAIRLWSLWTVYQQKRIARNSLTIVNSRKLYDELRHEIPNLVETRTTTLDDSSFFVRSDTCASPPYRLLYTGRMDRAKGLFEMVEALSILVREGQDVILDLVGWPQKGDDVLGELLAFAEQQGVSDRVRYHGYKPVGPELFNYYKTADVYVLASKSSFEGFPRTIWEAMAHSLPVVATTVGSIPHYLDGAAELVPPRDANALAAAVARLLTTPSLRQRLIRKGFALARENTLEARTGEMVRHIEAWVEKNSVRGHSRSRPWSLRPAGLHSHLEQAPTEGKEAPIGD